MSPIKEKTPVKKVSKIKKKSGAKKPKQNNEKALKLQVDELKDKHLRLKAEYENYRRRKSEEISKLLHYGGESIVQGLLPIIDDFERAISSSDSSKDSLFDGIKLVQTKIDKFFDAMEIKQFGEEGEKMDPEFHDAMLTQKDKKFDDGIILSVFEKGYTYRDKVIRHAKVIVNKK